MKAGRAWRRPRQHTSGLYLLWVLLAMVSTPNFPGATSAEVGRTTKGAITRARIYFLSVEFVCSGILCMFSFSGGKEGSP